MNKVIVILVPLLVITSLVFGGCSGTTNTTTSQTITSPSSTTQTKTSTSTTQPSPTSPGTVSWLDVSQYTGIPSSDCREPVTDLTGLPAASFNLTVDTTKQVGILDNSLWAKAGLSDYNCGVTDDNIQLWELNRQTGAFQYVRIFGPFTDGINKWWVDSAKKLIVDGQLPYESDLPKFYEGWRLYTEDENGNPVYNFWHLDCVIDSFLSAGMKPIVGVGFMPDALAEGEKVRNFDGGLVNTPRDYDKWRDLVYTTVKHCIERYGVEEVRTWYWSVGMNLI